IDFLLPMKAEQQKDVLSVKLSAGGITQGGTVTLGCQYNTSGDNHYLYWYKQDGHKSPKFILSRFRIGEGKTEAGDRFSSTLDSSIRSVPLKIQKLQLSDSAVYYCALQPTVTGNSKTLYKNLWMSDRCTPPLFIRTKFCGSFRYLPVKYSTAVPRLLRELRSKNNPQQV
uniref:Ig-like domain-containing protein n=1 Tax=Oreochromis niloticus TaxID=8128 RepID=A0A669BMP0_ORENI